MTRFKNSLGCVTIRKDQPTLQFIMINICIDFTSFVIARQVGAKEAFGFDDHFKPMGFILRP